MGIGLDPDTSITLVCAVAVALMFGLIAAALHGSAAGRHYQRRLNLVYDRARGNSSPKPPPPYNRFRGSKAPPNSIASPATGCRVARC